MNDDVATRLAREHLAGNLSKTVPIDGGNLMQFQNACEEIATALEQDEQPEVRDIEQARTHLRQLHEHLDDVCALYDIPRWQTGVRWDELSDSEQKSARGRHTISLIA